MKQCEVNHTELQVPTTHVFLIAVFSKSTLPERHWRLIFKTEFPLNNKVITHLDFRLKPGHNETAHFPKSFYCILGISSSTLSSEFHVIYIFL